MNKEEAPQKIACVFATYKGDTLIGYRQDTFGTTGKTWAKVYGYSAEQVDIILKNVKSEMNHSGSSLLKMLASMSNVAVNASTGESIAMSSAVEQVVKQEAALRELEEFELRVLPFPVSAEEFYGLGEGDEWRKNQILEELESVEPLEVYKFKVTSN
jgi:hypothetical protein